jgi:hypothetical protein
MEVKNTVETIEIEEGNLDDLDIIDDDNRLLVYVE